MLTHIHIRNFIIVESLSLDFQQGLHVLTGETGAGKSIWIDAIQIGLGNRTDASIIFPGEKTCDITLCFDLRALPAAKAWLIDQGYPCEDECIIRRTIDQEKSTRTTLNGMPIPQQLIRQFSDYILLIHGQHAHQQLLKSDAQRDYIDRYANHQSLLESCKKYYNEWRTLQTEIDKKSKQSETKTSDLALWQYQRDELEKLNLIENEYETLFVQYQSLHRSKQASEQLQSALEILDNEEISPIKQLEKAQYFLRQPSQNDTSLKEMKSLLESARIHAQEAQESLYRYLHKTDVSEETLLTIEKRLNTLQDVARKHRVEPTALLSTLQSLKDNIDALEKSDEQLQTLKSKQQEILVAFEKTATKLSEKRKKAATNLSSLITTQLQTLGMEGSVFTIALHPIDTAIHQKGLEEIQFLIAPNPGQTPQPLPDILSGGELSRLSLTIQALTAEKYHTPTLIFDEVDVGIGGKTADLVGKLLQQLGEHTQVLCVTHLPQVAAYGHHHYQAKKMRTDKKTMTTMHALTTEERTQEIARMLSGAEVTEKSLLNATELLQYCSKQTEKAYA